MLQIVSDPTRVTKTSSTLVDQVYSNQPENIDFISDPKCSISDHYQICICIFFKESDFIEHLPKCSFDSILEIDDPDEVLLVFLNISTEVLDQHAPVIKKAGEIFTAK